MATGYEVREIDRPGDPRLTRVHELIIATLADPDTLLGLDRLQEFLAANRADGPRRFHVLAASASRKPEAIRGATVFSYIPGSNCGFSEYIVAAKDTRGAGVGRLLFEARKAILDDDARQGGAERCHGLFIEVEHPDRAPEHFLAAERETALEAWERWRLFEHLGFWRVDLPYTQPPLAEAKSAVTYLELMFAPWDEAVRASRRLPAAWVANTLRPIWAAWAPRTYERYYEPLVGRLAHEVRLLPLFPR
jgi:hypothetical protein